MPKRSDFTTEDEWLEHLRIYFAARAMQAMVGRGEDDGQVSAEAAYRYADAMLAARKSE